MSIEKIDVGSYRTFSAAQKEIAEVIYLLKPKFD